MFLIYNYRPIEAGFSTVISLVQIRFLLRQALAVAELPCENGIHLAHTMGNLTRLFFKSKNVPMLLLCLSSVHFKGSLQDSTTQLGYFYHQTCSMYNVRVAYTSEQTTHWIQYYRMIRNLDKLKSHASHEIIFNAYLKRLMPNSSHIA